MGGFSVIFVIAIILLIVLAAAWVLLPSKRSATRQCSFNASIEEVWKVYTDPASQPAWRSKIDRVEMHAPTHPRRWSEFTRHGPPVTLEEQEVSPPNRLILSTGARNFFNGRYVAEFTQDKDGRTIGTFTESATLNGFIPRVLSALFVRPEKLIETYALEAMAEIKRRRMKAG